MTANECRDRLKVLIHRRVGDGAGTQWLEAQLGSARADAVGGVMAEVGRRLGRRPLIAGFAERTDAKTEGVYGEMRVGHWGTDEAARTLLLAAAVEGTEAPFSALFNLYDQGETETRVAALRAINFVVDADAQAGMNLVHDAGRTYLSELMDAAWCNNPFTAQHMTKQEYRKAVLKSLFCEIPIDGFLGLSDRADQEMAESLQDFADERAAAGRVIPSAVWIVAAVHPRPGLVARLLGLIEHPAEEE
ncbi:MAG TPA: EboA domain-containing protein, partial [Sphingomonas sanguinis]|uniref:EboA domain-containing protein n=1 Tax=Sphingomonas sanguinis TaxID=33051 RepID=UPI002ABFFF21|nr:EboA domain-containing protein [Sphingomonas sanguinis]